MPRMSLEEVRDVVAAKITGEYITHNDLVAALEADGNGNLAVHLPNLVRADYISRSVVSVPDGKPELRYSLPG